MLDPDRRMSKISWALNRQRSYRSNMMSSKMSKGSQESKATSVVSVLKSISLRKARTEQQSKLILNKKLAKVAKKWNEIFKSIGIFDKEMHLRAAFEQVIVGNYQKLSSLEYKMKSGYESQKGIFITLAFKLIRAKDPTITDEEIETYRRHIDTITSQNEEIKKLTPVECFGHEILEDNLPLRKYTMQCLTDCCIGKMSIKHFDITIKRLKQT